MMMEQKKRTVDIKKSHWLAIKNYYADIEYGCSTGIDDSITRGYGKLDEYGFWEYPLFFMDEQ